MKPVVVYYGDHEFSESFARKRNTGTSLTEIVGKLNKVYARLVGMGAMHGPHDGANLKDYQCCCIVDPTDDLCERIDYQSARRPYQFDSVQRGIRRGILRTVEQGSQDGVIVVASASRRPWLSEGLEYLRPHVIKERDEEPVYHSCEPCD